MKRIPKPNKCSICGFMYKACSEVAKIDKCKIFNGLGYVNLCWYFGNEDCMPNCEIARLAHIAYFFQKGLNSCVGYGIDIPSKLRSVENKDEN